MSETLTFDQVVSETAADSLLNQGRNAHPGIDLSPAVFFSRLDSVLQKNKLSAPDCLADLHAPDLYLTTVCAEKIDAAWQRLRALYLRPLTDMFGYNGSSVSPVSSRAGNLDCAETLLNELFLPDRSGRCRIASYDGRSSLTTWLRVIVGHRRINERIRNRHEACGLDDVREAGDPAALSRVESVLTDARYEPVAISAFAQACSCLSAGERQLLVSRYVGNVNLGRIAVLAGVHQSTISRQIERICKRVRAETVAILSRDHHLPSAAVEACLGILAEAGQDSQLVTEALGTASGEMAAAC